MLIFGSVLLGISTWLFYTEGATNPPLLLPLYALTGLLIGVVSGAHPYVMVRAFPAAIRFSGVSFSYGVANAVIGGLTPLLISLLLPWVPFAHVYYVLGPCATGCAVGISLSRR